MKKIDLQLILKQKFGFKTFKPGQKEVLEQLMAHNDTLAVLPTGAGKTLIYQIYGILQASPIIIVSPLLSLMQDQVSRLQYLGAKRTVALTSALDWRQKWTVLDHLNDYQYIYISPEMLSQPDILKAFKKIHPGLMVIDEAHCLSQWGPDFRPEYLNLKSILCQLDEPLTLMLTATASKQVQTDIINKLGLAQHSVAKIIKSVNRPNIYLSVQKVNDQHEKQQRLLALITKLRSPGIIYFLSRKLANQMALWINTNSSLRAAAYHSGLGMEDRFKIQHQFMNDQLDVICATSAFGMGIDKNNVRFVIHYHLPADLESYMQEIGRAGRDGHQSIAIILYQDGDESLPAYLTANNIPDSDVIHTFFRNPQHLSKLSIQDEQIKLLNFYWKHGYSADQLINLFELRHHQQQHNLAELMDYLFTSDCRRKQLMQYFDQIAPGHTDKCCDRDVIDLPLSKLGLQKDKKNDAKIAPFDWQSIIQKLFKID